SPPLSPLFPYTTLFRSSILAHRKGTEVVNLDKLTYAANLENLADVVGHPGYRFIQADIGDARAVQEVLAAGFDAVVNFAAETHRSEEHTSELQSPDHLV